LTKIKIASAVIAGCGSTQITFAKRMNLVTKHTIVTADVYRGFSRALAHSSLTLRHWSGVRPYTSPFGFAEPYVFVKQSGESLSLRPPLSGGTTSSKDTSSLFAEFLEDCYPVRLSVLHQSTCVGLRYGII